VSKEKRFAWINLYSGVGLYFSLVYDQLGCGGLRASDCSVIFIFALVPGIWTRILFLCLLARHVQTYLPLCLSFISHACPLPCSLSVYLSFPCISATALVFVFVFVFVLVF